MCVFIVCVCVWFLYAQGSEGKLVEILAKHHNMHNLTTEEVCICACVCVCMYSQGSEDKLDEILAKQHNMLNLAIEVRVYICMYACICVCVYI
jgi:hypothetical protein